MAQAQLEMENFQLTQTHNLERDQKDLQTLINTFTEEIGSQPDLDFSTDDNDVHHVKKEK